MIPQSNQSLTKDPYVAEHAKVYEQKRFNSSRRMRALDRIEQQFAKDLMKIIGAEGAVLDIPCGTGRFTSIFSNAWRVYNCDVNDNMLAEAKKAHSHLANCEFMQADARNIPLADNQVELVFCMRLLHHVDEPEVRVAILTELARVSLHLVATSFYRKECFRYFRKWLKGKPPVGPIWAKTFEEEAKQAGLKVLKWVPSYLNGSSQTLVLLEKCWSTDTPAKAGGQS